MNLIRTAVALFAALSPIAVLIAGGLALGMSIANGDWTRACMVVLIVCVYVLVFDRDIRRY